jgi:hypothetical protein
MNQPKPTSVLNVPGLTSRYLNKALLAAADAFFAASAASTSTGHCSDSTTVAVDTMAAPSNANTSNPMQAELLAGTVSSALLLDGKAENFNERQND